MYCPGELFLWFTGICAAIALIIVLLTRGNKPLPELFELPPGRVGGYRREEEDIETGIVLLDDYDYDHHHH